MIIWSLLYFVSGFEMISKCTTCTYQEVGALTALSMIFECGETLNSRHRQLLHQREAALHSFFLSSLRSCLRFTKDLHSHILIFGGVVVALTRRSCLFGVATSMFRVVVTVVSMLTLTLLNRRPHTDVTRRIKRCFLVGVVIAVQLSTSTSASTSTKYKYELPTRRVCVVLYGFYRLLIATKTKTVTGN